MKVLVLAFVAIVVAVSAVPHRQWRTNRAGSGEPECQATAVQIAYGNDALIISWTIASNSCSVKIDHYKVLLTINDTPERLDPLGPLIPILQYPMDTPSCEQISAVVESYVANENDPIAKTEPENLKLKLPNIEGVDHTQDADGVTISWKALDLPKCTVEYILTGDGAPVDPITLTSHKIPTAELKACENTALTIQATSNGIISDTKSYDFTTQMSAVELTKADNTAEGIEIDFKPLVSVPEACGSVTYKVVEKEQACFKSSYGVFAVSEQNKLGLEASEDIGKKPTGVNNLQADIRGNEIQLEWKPPTGGEKCNLEYTGTYGEHVLDKPVHSTSLTFPYATHPCTVDDIVVWAIGNGLEGDKATISIVGTFGKVVNLTCKLDTGSTVNCEWKEPDGCADSKDMSYEVTYYDGARVSTVTRHEETLTFETTSCKSSWVSVTPQLGDSAGGDFTEVSVDCPTSFISF